MGGYSFSLAETIKFEPSFAQTQFVQIISKLADQGKN